MTKIVNIAELYETIPETRKLEGVNFSNLRQLLTSVIQTVEESGNFEFVQYIQGNPSLFVVRQKPARSDDRLTNERATSVPDFQFETTKRGKVKVKTSEKTPEYTEMYENKDLSSSNDSNLFPPTKLPW